ncbi:MAG TPA: saccharopine dehydrogenase C-terminal domain-containing protein, partial [Ignavibacteriaceae bacterium]|nr:saccharopine dehydrogenase C-terminal domain-containing protein [Ignavibacteriaceae bacterium]
GFIGFKVLKNVIKAGKDIVDISFFNEDPFLLNEEAEKKGLTVIVDCGISPGLSNLILGYHNKRMKVEKYECFVGGLPTKRVLPFEYSAPFSPIDVIEEYTRPARLVEGGKIIVKSPLSELVQIEIEPVGTLEAFNTDGLRTLLKTTRIPFMKEKTLRYPGHIEKISFLAECGFFNTKVIQINGGAFRPIDFTSRILLPLWEQEKNQNEFTAMKIVINGKEKGRSKEHIYELFDQYDEKTGATSMARTTGYTCTGAAKLILDGKFGRKGICPPEYIGADGKLFDQIINHLASRNIKLRHIERDI